MTFSTRSHTCKQCWCPKLTLRVSMKLKYQMIVFIVISILFLNGIWKGDLDTAFKGDIGGLGNTINHEYANFRKIIFENLDPVGPQDLHIHLLHEILRRFNFTLCTSGYEDNVDIERLLPPYLHLDQNCSRSSLELTLNQRALDTCATVSTLADNHWCIGVLFDRVNITPESKKASANVILFMPKYTEIPSAASEFKIIDDANLPFWPDSMKLQEASEKGHSERSWLFAASVGGVSKNDNDFLTSLLTDLKLESYNTSNIVIHESSECFGNINIGSPDDVWVSCADSIKDLRNANFCLVLPPNFQHGKRIRTYIHSHQMQLVTCLHAGSIPIILKGEPPPLDDIFPFYPLLKTAWNDAVVFFEVNDQLSLLDFLKAIPVEQQMHKKLMGSQILNFHLKSRDAQIKTLLLFLHKKLSLQKLPEPVITTNSYPIEKKYRMCDTETLTFMKGKDNSSREKITSDFRYRQEWQYLSEFYHFQSIPRNSGNLVSLTVQDAEGNADIQRDQFTVVILTYDRFKSLQRTLKSLNGLENLRSIIVIWNNQEIEPDVMSWPRLHCSIKVVKSPENSLNVRFLPYDLINTVAVFSLDDDQIFRHSEILEAFGLWKRNPARLVGFHARRLIWNKETGNFDYLPSSEYYSMILTGATFIHRYYFFAYTYEMPPKLREFVRRTMNCEDIAMNFLVSHLSGNPPLKVRRRRFLTRSPARSSLSARPKHYLERTHCIAIFTSIYGYLPLKNTSFLA